MIKGFEIFKDYFREYQEEYILIGGAACDIIFNEADLSFRATKDFDMVLIVEALTPDFGKRFWDFIDQGGYENRVKSNGAPQFYRFDKPKSADFPYMIELFAKSESIFDKDVHGCRPIHLGDEVTSFSAILLDDEYYRLLLSGKIVISEVPILAYTHLVLFKVKAWLNLAKLKESGEQISEKDIKKHKNDVARLATLFTGNESCAISVHVMSDLQTFLEAFEKEPPDIKMLGLTGITAEDILTVLKSAYLTQ